MTASRCSGGESAHRALYAFVLDADLDRLRDAVEVALHVADADAQVAFVALLRGADAVDRPAVRHREYPCHAAAAIRVELRCLLPDLEEDLLHDLLRLRAVTQQPDDQAQDARRDAVVDLGESSAVTLGDIPQQALDREIVGDLRLGHEAQSHTLASFGPGLDTSRAPVGQRVGGGDGVTHGGLLSGSAVRDG